MSFSTCSTIDLNNKYDDFPFWSVKKNKLSIGSALTVPSSGGVNDFRILAMGRTDALLTSRKQGMAAFLGAIQAVGSCARSYSSMASLWSVAMNRSTISEITTVADRIEYAFSIVLSSSSFVTYS